MNNSAFAEHMRLRRQGVDAKKLRAAETAGDQLDQRVAANATKKYNSLDHEAAKEAAALNGLEIVLPAPNELQVDIDCEADYNAWLRGIVKLQEVIPCSYVVLKSPSGLPHHFHITVTLQHYAPGPAERVMLQALLGSDRMREMLSWRRILEGNPHPTLFFEKPDADEVPWLCPYCGLVGNHESAPCPSMLGARRA